jgi:hypothetical protein
MKKISGVKSVDFKIMASGFGVVNWNGPTTLLGEDGNEIRNHILPKLRGYTNLSGKVKAENGYKYKKTPEDIDFHETPLYISQNCIRHHLFRDQAYDLHFAKNKDVEKILASITGLVKGYVLPLAQYKRSSALLLTDFVDQLGKGNFERLTRSGSKQNSQYDKDADVSSDSFYSKTTFGETKYIAHGSINIERLSFISLDKEFDRAAMLIKDDAGEPLANRIQDFIASLDSKDSKRKPLAIFHPNYVRQGTIFEEGEVGILLNNDAIDILINETLRMITELNIVQGKGFMSVKDIIVDYNDSGHTMRIMEDDKNIASQLKKNSYAVYYYAKA